MILSWTDELMRAYDILNSTNDRNLLPLCHSTQNAQITIDINSDGTIPSIGFAEKVEKEDAVTIIPVTEDSSSRGAGINPHPLADKLIYIAGDYPKYADVKKSNNSDYYNAYIENLKKWCESGSAPQEVKAVYTYLSKGTIIADLIDAGIFTLNEKGKLSDEKIANTDPTDCFVRFSVDGKKLWKDESLYQAYIAYACGDCATSDICYATGEHGGITYKHPSKIRNTGDKAKLFSTNDESGFSYRGRFADKTQATAISFDYSQKLHNALKCLIKKQGYIVDGLCILVWENNLEEIQKPFEGCSFDDDEDGYIPESNTGEINKTLTIASITGTKNKYKSDSKTLLIMFDSATTGRLSMTEYAEVATSDYLSNLEKWHRDTSWICYGKRRSFSVYEIAACAYGNEEGSVLKPGEKTKKDVYQRLIPYIVCGGRIPQDIVNQLFIRACRYNAFDNKSNNWQRVVNCACGMIRKRIIETKGECTMSLEKECCDRDYLYGRLLAVADYAEGSTYDDNENRPTNAKRLIEAFSNHPCETWKVLCLSLRPYLNRMNIGKRSYFERMINQITAMFPLDSYNDNSPLSSEFLHAYSCQMMLSATQNAKSGKPRDKPKLSGINQHKADCYAVCCVSQVVYPARYSKVSCQKNRCVFASIFLYLLKRRSVLNNRFKLF